MEPSAVGAEGDSVYGRGRNPYGGAGRNNAPKNQREKHHTLFCVDEERQNGFLWMLTEMYT